jgi:hypothetical protein
MTRNCLILTSLCMTIVVCMDTNGARAGLIPGITATASSEFKPAQNTVDYVNGFDAASQTVTSTNSNDTGTMWNTSTFAGETKASIWIGWNLGATQTVGDMWVFNYNDGPANPADPSGHSFGNRGFSTADIWYATSTPTVANPTIANPGNWTRWANDQAFLPATYSDTYNTPTKLTLGISAQYILMNDVVTIGLDGLGNQSYGLSKVEFFTTTPEPASAVLLGIGTLGLAAYAWRKRKTLVKNG